MRTPKKIIETARREFTDAGHVVNSIDKQAYLSSLALANSIVVTCDSTSMISEVATSGKPIFVAHMQPRRNNHRFKKFFQLYNEMGITRNLGDKIESCTYKRFNEAERVATIVSKKLNN